MVTTTVSRRSDSRAPVNAAASWSGTAEPFIVRQLRHDVARFAHRHGFDDRTIDDINTCLSEALTNAVVHAYRDRTEPGTVTVAAQLDDDELVIRVGDNGLGLRPRTDSSGLGLGVPIIAAVADAVSIDASPTEGTELRVSFKRAGRSTKSSGTR
jgi:serine/threonine-protein kinase RsbW